MDGEGLTRRSFVAGSGAFVGAAFSRLGMAGFIALGQAACRARDEGAAFTVLSRAEALELEAIAARILPTTDTPGAREAGVVHFMDQAFASFMESALPMVRAGLAACQERIAIDYPGARALVDLEIPTLDHYLQAQEGSPFFEFVRVLTLTGFFGMRSYGGNHDQAGWQLLGIEPGEHAHAYPFGWYDAHAAQKPDGA